MARARTPMREALVWPGALGVLGAILGSFIAALAIRWPQDRSVLTGRSACDACGRTLAARDLVPILSHVALRGQCRYCGGAIDPRHLVIEVLALGIGVAAGVVAPGATGLAGAAFGWLLLALAALDAAAFWLPDRLTVPLAGLGVVAGWIGVPPSLPDRLIGGAAGFAGLWLIGECYRRVRGRDGLGGGDPKLLGAIGLWLGWRMVPATLLLACLIGLGWVAWRALSGRGVAGDAKVPLGTLMAIAAYPAWLAMIGFAG